MKLLILSLLCAASALAQTPVPATPTAPAPAATADELRSAPLVDGYTLMKKPEQYDGKIIKLRFTARGSAVSNGLDGTSTGDLGIEVQKIWYNIRVVFPSSQNEWFMRLGSHSAGVRFVYARLAPGSNGHTATILGREVRNGPNGPEIAW